MNFQQNPLGYSYADLEPYIDTQTMELHYGKHHAGYVEKLNKALEGIDINFETLETLLQNIEILSEEKRQTINNNGFQHYNHEFFWKIMTPGGAKNPEGALAKSINQTFGSFDEFKKQFGDLATKQFGSGWTWLYKTDSGELKITSLANEGSPVKERGNTPLLCLDIWEHAYYLKYQNRRLEFIENWWNTVNWDIVAELHA